MGLVKNKIPKKYEVELMETIVNINKGRAAILVVLILILELMLLAMSFMPFATIHYTYLVTYRFLYAFMIGTCIVHILLIELFKIKWLLKPKILERYLIAIAGIVLSWSAVISVLDQSQNLNGFTYFFFALAVAIIFYSKPYQSAFFYGISLVVYMVMIFDISLDSKMMFSSVVNTLTVIITAWVIGVIITKGYIKTFIKTKVIEQQNKELEQTVLIDHMTDLYNRRGLEKHLQIFKEQTNTSLAAYMIDIDFFKGLNDTYGHDKGDYVLKKIADIIIKQADAHKGVACRYGGDEICLVIPDLNKERLLLLKEEIMRDVLALKINNEASKTSEYVSVSCGCHMMSIEDIVDTWALIKGADEQLYKAKYAR